MERVYKDTNTDYQEVVRVGDQKWEIIEITIPFHYFFYKELSSPTVKKAALPKMPIRTQNLNLT